ncbi:MAG: PDZ domain-containing protein, partial [Thermoanaerobaculia bacterium]
MRADRSARVLLAATLTVALAAMLYLQVAEAVRSAERRMGFVPEEGAGAILVESLTPGLPAERAGLRPGDRILSADGVRMRKDTDWGLAAADFRAGTPVRLRVERQGEVVALTVVPGVPLQWLRLLIGAITTLCFLGLGLVALLQQRERDIRGRLLLLFAVAVALELALPIQAIGDLWVGLVALAGYYLLTGFQIGAELHLASLIPERQPWVRRRPWVIPLYYTLGLGLGVTTAVTFVCEQGFGWDPFPWTSTQLEWLLLDVGLPVWALGVTILLAIPALRHPAPQGRQQAGLVLAGVIPWLLFVLATTAFDLAGRQVPPWLTGLEPLILALYPIAVFAAIYRYRLFDIELVVRRGLLYTTLTGVLVVVFYGALGAGGTLMSRFLDREGSVWVISAATLLSGLLFFPLRGLLQRQIDRRLFPERLALRQSLIALAGELPALGKLPRMGEHLVERLCAVFGARSATILIANPGSGVLSALASSRPWRQEELDRALFL